MHNIFNAKGFIYFFYKCRKMSCILTLCPTPPPLMSHLQVLFWLHPTTNLPFLSEVSKFGFRLCAKVLYCQDYLNTKEDIAWFLEEQNKK